MQKRTLLVTLAACALLLGAALPLATSRASNANPWKGDYFQNRTLSGTPAATQDDAVITFKWGYLPPISGWPSHENFSVRWTITDDFGNGNYTFAALSDDGVRMYVDGKLVVDAWYDQEHMDWHQAVVPMTAGKHKVKVEYYQHNGWAQIQAGYYPSQPATAAKTSTPGPSPTPAPPTLAPTPRPTRTPSLFGTVGSQPTTVHQPPPSFGSTQPAGGGAGATSSPNDLIIAFNESKYLVWEGFPGPALHAGGQSGQFGYVKNRSIKPTFRTQWNIVVTQGGYYDIYVFIPSGPNATATAAYRIFHNGELSPAVVLDQSAKGDQWVLLGSFYLVSGKSADQYVYLDNQTAEDSGTRNVLIDAIRLVYRP